MRAVVRVLLQSALIVPTLLSVAGRGPEAAAPLRTQTTTSDLDAFMAQVLARRDDNWTRLQQYVLDERERAELRGPGETLLYGLDRDYTWYIRDGVFVRSPVRVDGVAVSEEDRLQFENEWLDRERRRDTGADGDPETDARATATGDAEALARLVREPRFVSAAYFLKFKFERGRYAYVGPEAYEGQRVLRIEYYPTRLFADDDQTGDRATQPDEDDEQEKRLERQMNKVALITLWVEPQAHQIVKYTFDNVDFDFLPGAWLVQVDTVKASMTMGQPFPGVWLPNDIDIDVALTLAIGRFEFRQAVDYRDYREASVASKVIIPGAR
jgi:hypothetical protein